MTLPGKVSDVKELKEWNFDGSSTKQAPGHDSDVFLVSPTPASYMTWYMCQCVNHTPSRL